MKNGVNNMQPEKDRKIYFELMRIIAAFFVIYNHTDAFHTYMHIDGAIRWLYMSLAVVTKLSVPLFFMISGALLLNKTDSISLVLRKRFFRILYTLLIFCALNFIMVNLDAFIDGDEYSFSIIEYFHEFLSGSRNNVIAYWFLYAYLGFLLSLPFLQRIARHITMQDFTVLFCLHFVLSSLIPILNILLSRFGLSPIVLSSNFHAPMATVNILFFPLIGYYLDHQVDIKAIRPKQMLHLFICTLVTVVVTCMCITYDGETTGVYSQQYVAIFDYWIAIFVFIGIKYLVVNAYPHFFTKNVAGLLTKAGALTFGVYLLDPILVFILCKKYAAFLEPYMPTLVISVGWCLISMVLGSMITFALKKMPILRKLL